MGRNVRRDRPRFAGQPGQYVVLSVSAGQLPYLGRPEEGVAMADLVLRLDPQLTPGRRGQLLYCLLFRPQIRARY